MNLEQQRKGRMNMLSDLQLVKGMLKLLKKARWQQGNNASDDDGHIVKPTDPTAVSFCIRGAALRVLNPDDALLSSDFCMDTPASVQIPRALGFKDNIDVIDWNDDLDRTINHVLDHLNRRLELIPQEEAMRAESSRAKKQAALDRANRYTALSRSKRKRPKVDELDNNRHNELLNDDTTDDNTDKENEDA